MGLTTAHSPVWYSMEPAPRLPMLTVAGIEFSPPRQHREPWVPGSLPGCPPPATLFLLPSPSTQGTWLGAG